jgi:chromosome partitioning protein
VVQGESRGSVALHNEHKSHFIVFANEKGGTGKSTTAVHAAVALAATGHRVAAIDLDHRQKTMTRYFDNREATARRRQLDLPSPRHVALDLLTPAGLDQEIARIGSNADFIVIDTPGRDDPVSRAAIAKADTIVTPINDSFVDLDLIGQVDAETFRVKKPSFYAELIWDLRKVRAQADGTTVDWVVLRNRLQHIEANNMRRVGLALTELSKRVGFRTIGGLGERVIYRELFPKGLTLLDVEAIGGIGISHIAARQELREMVAGFALPVRNSDQQELMFA